MMHVCCVSGLMSFSLVFRVHDSWMNSHASLIGQCACASASLCVCVYVFASSKGQAERLCHTPTSAQTCTSLVYHVQEIRASLRKTACSPGGG